MTEGVTYAPTTGTSVGDPKTRKSNRVVVLSRDLCAVLDLYRATREHGTDDYHYLIPGHERYSRIIDPTRPLNPDAASKQTIALIVGADLLADDGKHYTDVQGLRSTGNSITAAAGIPKPLRQAQMGHDGDDVNERHYLDIANAPERFRLADVFEALSEVTPDCTRDIAIRGEAQAQLDLF